MKKIKVMFEQNPAIKGIEVMVRASEYDDEVTGLIDRIEETTNVLTVSGMDGSYINIQMNEIILISVYGKQVRVVTEHESCTIAQSLQSLENILEKYQFMRISRFEIVNLDKVRKFDFTLSGTLRMELMGGMEVWASRRKIPLIRKKLMERE